VAERFDAVAGQKTIAVDLDLLRYDDQGLSDLELFIRSTAKQHEAHTLDLLQTVPGIGTILSLVLFYAIHQIDRFPRVQDFASYCRLVKCAKASGGKRVGTSGNKSGNAHLTWTVAAAAPLCLRGNEPGQKSLARLEKQHDKGKALRMLAHKLARVVYDMRKRTTAFDLEHFLHTEGSSAGEPGASLDTEGMRLPQARSRFPLDCVCARQGVQRPPIPAPAAVDWTPALAPDKTAMVATGAVGGSSPAPGTHGRVTH
jgi:hypothetical protein